MRHMRCSVINATGIILHTNLGRAPVSRRCAATTSQICPERLLKSRVRSAARRAQLALRARQRPRERSHRRRRLRSLLTTAPLRCCSCSIPSPKAREVVVARNQLVEIGGGFRVPDVLERSGATLVEVGTTNRVYVEDFERALSPRTALLLRTHPSNYRIEGFTHDASRARARRTRPARGRDRRRGSRKRCASSISRTFGIAHERTVQEALGDGIGLVTFSGDKLLGGPQAGIIVGRSHLIAPLKSNPVAARVARRKDDARCARRDAAALSRRHRSGKAFRFFECWRQRSRCCANVRAPTSTQYHAQK